MQRKLMPIIVVNALLILLFLIANYAMWNMVNSNTHLGHTVMNPINVIESMWGDVVDGEIYRIDGMGIMPNFPFWLFFVAIGVNLYFIFKLQRSKETNSITKCLPLILIGILVISCVGLLTVKSVNAQSTPAPEISVLYPNNGTFFNVSMGVVSFQLKYATNNSLSWIGYSIDGGQNKTAYGEWYDLEQRLYDAKGNPSVWVYGVFENDGNHNLTLYANNTAGDWATPQTVTYFVNINADTTFPPTTSNPTTIQSASLPPTSTPTLSPTDRNAPHLDPRYYLIPVSVILAVVILVPVLFFRRYRKTTYQS